MNSQQLYSLTLHHKGVKWVENDRKAETYIVPERKPRSGTVLSFRF